MAPTSQYYHNRLVIIRKSYLYTHTYTLVLKKRDCQRAAAQIRAHHRHHHAQLIPPRATHDCLRGDASNDRSGAPRD